jgi:penicillin-binding protein 2
MVNRSNIFYYLVLILFFILFIRLAQLQIFECKKYKELARNNTTRTSLTRAPRGVIYDRNNNILATSKQSLSVIVYPAVLKSMNDKQSVAKLLANFIELSEEELLKIFEEMDPSAPLPLTLDNDIAIESAIKIYENKKHLPGIAVEEQATRYYPYHEIGAHMLGYIGQVNNYELKEGKSRGLSLGDIVGKDGLERVFDQSLQGTKGEARVPVDRFGKSIKFTTDEQQEKEIKKAIKGRDIYLTIDIDLQKVAQDALADRMGSVVALNNKTGEIYVLVSSPSFDPNIFTRPVPTKIFNELMYKKAFINRAISSYTPGSIIKPVTSLAALEYKVTNPYEILIVSGSYNFNGYRFGDWTSEISQMNIKEALVWSRNTFFYQIAKRMKPEWISDLLKEFGAGSETDVELKGESAGIVPDPEWKKKNMRENWFPGNTLHLAIGQSFLQVSPIQAAKMYAAIANEGLVPQPHLVKNFEKEQLMPMTININSESYQLVKQALNACVKRGTGQASNLDLINVAGKTGSAEVFGYAKSTHGWFASYAPAEDPEIVVVVFMEGGGHGGSVAAPIAKKIFEAYFAKIKANAETKSLTTNS